MCKHLSCTDEYQTISSQMTIHVIQFLKGIHVCARLMPRSDRLKSFQLIHVINSVQYRINQWHLKVNDFQLHDIQ